MFLLQQRQRLGERELSLAEGHLQRLEHGVVQPRGGFGRVRGGGGASNSTAETRLVSASTGSAYEHPSARNRSTMFVAEALTRRRRGTESAPADVGEMASAACLS